MSPGMASLVAGHDAIVWSAGAGGGHARPHLRGRSGCGDPLDGCRARGGRAPVCDGVVLRRAARPRRAARATASSRTREAKAAADAHLRASALEWTIVAPSALTLHEPTGRIDPDASESGAVSRADVAAVVAAALARSVVGGSHDPLQPGRGADRRGRRRLTAAWTRRRVSEFAALLRERRAAARADARAATPEDGRDLLSARGDGTADDEHDPEGSTLSGEWAMLEALRADTERELVEIDAALRAARSRALRPCATVCGRDIPVGPAARAAGGDDVRGVRGGGRAPVGRPRSGAVSWRACAAPTACAPLRCRSSPSG